MSVTAAIRRMLDAGLTIDQALTAAECFEAAKPRSTNAERQARYRARKQQESVTNNVTSVTDVTDNGLLSPEGSPPTPPSPKPLSSTPPSPPKGGSSPTNFETFWSVYPNRVGKRDAEKAFVKARKRADLETILAGLRRYVAKTDDRPWCNPATWLNQDRWEDAPAIAPKPQATAPPPKPRNAGELSRMQLKAMSNGNAPSNQTGYIDHRDGNADHPGSGIARRFAVPASG